MNKFTVGLINMSRSWFSLPIVEVTLGNIRNFIIISQQAVIFSVKLVIFPEKIKRIMFCKLLIIK
jgi:hypothetical protein